jgi:hypothetical protein
MNYRHQVREVATPGRAFCQSGADFHPVRSCSPLGSWFQCAPKIGMGASHYPPTNRHCSPGGR